MLSFREAQQEIIRHAHSWGKEKVSIDDSLGRILAESVYADRDYPPFDRVTMDGYAFRTEDFEAGIREFRIIEIVFAGQLSKVNIERGQCFKIMTGAPLPSSADIVVRKEDTSENSSFVQINLTELKPYQNVARRGEDVQSGKEIIAAYQKVGPDVITALASLGKAEVMVEKLPDIALFTTGDEVVPVSQPVLPHQIRNSNAHLLKSLLKQWNIVPSIVSHIPDNEDDLARELSNALSSDIMIMCGGVSAGDADYVPKILDAVGVKKLFHKVAIKPGKPIWCGTMPGGGIVFALPGNPLSCHVTFKLFIESYLRYAFGMGSLQQVKIPVAEQRIKKTAFDEFFPVKFNNLPLSAYPLHFNGSGDILAALGADAFALHPAGQMLLEEGEMVECILI